MVKPIFRGIRAVYEIVRFLRTAKRYGADVPTAFEKLPRLVYLYVTRGKVGYNLHPHLVYYFGQSGVDNLITKNKPWLEKLADFLRVPYSPDKNTLTYTFASAETIPGINSYTLQSRHHHFKIQRGSMTLIDGDHKVLVLPNYGRDPKITTMLSNDFWAFLATIKFYCPEIDYVAIVNCDPAISYISTCPCEDVTIDGKAISLFACPASILKPIIGTEAIRA